MEPIHRTCDWLSIYVSRHFLHQESFQDAKAHLARKQKFHSRNPSGLDSSAIANPGFLVGNFNWHYRDWLQYIISFCNSCFFLKLKTNILNCRQIFLTQSPKPCDWNFIFLDRQRSPRHCNWIFLNRQMISRHCNWIFLNCQMIPRDCHWIFLNRQRSPRDW